MITFRRMALLSIGTLLFTACGDDAPAKVLSGYELDPAPVVGAVTLPDTTNGDADFAMRADDGHLLIVYFGYTQCPDVCPTTLADVKKALKEMGSAADRVDLAMATIDPNRDTDDVISGYVRSFIPGAHALRTEDPERLRAAADAFGVSYSVTPTADGTFEVTHSAAMYVVDSTGTVLVTWPFGLAADAIATDLEILLARGSS
ncbi:MAG TPA: SCO family protein [Ilumatobacteraceae bacterium]|nr:SCO family protein [Ilumatobacteraceae bacterium]HRB04173.1 SCO family protein [Ilumatobacteraceae bacterium]